MSADIYDLVQRMDYDTLRQFEANQQEENLFFDFKERSVSAETE